MNRSALAILAVVLLASATPAQTYVNGPIITHPTGGFGGAPASSLEATFNNFGFGCGGFSTFNNRIADDFTVPCGQTWAISSIRTFGYQTQATASTVSTLNQGNYRIWKGQPGVAGSTILYDFALSNQMTGTGFTGVYRAQSTTLTNNLRPVFYVDMGGNGIVLPAGKYFLDYQMAGTLAGTVFTPPITILGSQTTGNAVQFAGTFVVPATVGTWNNGLLSGTTPANLSFQGVPFEINYTMGTANCWTYDIVQSGGAGGSVTLANLGGTPGNGYLNVVTTAPGGFPNGWAFGIDISVPELTAELNSGPLFSGTLDFSGNAIIPLGPVSLGGGSITVYYVGIQLSGATVISVDTPKSVTIM